MKASLLFLLLLNLLFYGWSQWVAVPPGGKVVATPEPEAERIALFRESFPQEAAAEDLDITTLEIPEDEDGDPTTPEPAASVADVADSTDAATPADADPSSEGSLPTQAEAADDAGEPSDTADAGEEIVAAAVDAPARCVQLGPFIRLTEATEAAAQLRDQGLTASQRIEQAQVWVGHWVYLPRFPSRAAAIAEVEKLRAGGITDNYIETSGELRNSVSLGLFSDLARAESRAAQARELGSDARIRDRLRSGDVYFLDFELPPDQDVDADAFTTQPRRPVTLEERDCPERDAARGSRAASGVS